MKKAIKILTILVIILSLSFYIFLRLLTTKLAVTGILNFYDMALVVQDFASKHNKLFFPKLYKKQIEDYLNRETENKIKELDKNANEAKAYHMAFLKNPNRKLMFDEYSNKMEEYSQGISSVDLDFAYELSKIEDRFLLIPIGALPTDWGGAYLDVLLPYFQKYKVDDSKLHDYYEYSIKKENEIEKYIDAAGKAVEEDKIPKMHLIHSFPIQGYFYYFCDNFDPNNYKRPKEIPQNQEYKLFIYDKNLSSANFKKMPVINIYFGGISLKELKDELEDYSDMFSNALSHNPKYFVQNDGNQTKICQLDENS